MDVGVSSSSVPYVMSPSIEESIDFEQYIVSVEEDLGTNIVISSNNVKIEETII